MLGINSVIVSLGYSFNSLFDYPAVKALSVFLSYILIHTIGVQNKDAALFILVLICLDFLTGFVCALKRKNISSVGVFKTLVKIFCYFTLLIVANYSLTVLIFAWLSPAIIGLIITTELISVLENIAILQPGLVPEWLLERLELQGKLIRRYERRGVKGKKTKKSIEGKGK